MFTLLSGQHVHEGESSGELLVRAATVPARALATVAAEVPEPIRNVVDRALAFDKEERWPDATTMLHQLVLACETSFGVSPSTLPGLVGPDIEWPSQVHDETTLPPVRSAPGRSSHRRTRPGRRARMAWVGAGVAAFAVMLGLTGVLRPRRHCRRRSKWARRNSGTLQLLSSQACSYGETHPRKWPESSLPRRPNSIRGLPRHICTSQPYRNG